MQIPVLDAPGGVRPRILADSSQQIGQKRKTRGEHACYWRQSTHAAAKAGGGFVWDEVLEYRVWCHPERRADDLDDGNDYYCAFGTYNAALEYSNGTEGAEAPVALIRQVEYIDESEPGKYVHIKEERITEWPVEFLRRPRRTANTIPAFLSPLAPANRLDILRDLMAGATH